MNEVMQNIVTRRSVRKFTDQHISAKELEQIVEAAVYAPSAMNRQSWHFTVIRSREKIQKLAAAIGGVLGNAAYNCYEPDTMILVAADRDNANGQLDTGCAMENIFLAAHSLGIGSVWINQARGICDEPAVRGVPEEYGVPDTHVVWGMAALGYAAETPADKPRSAGTVNYVE